MGTGDELDETREGEARQAVEPAESGHLPQQSAGGEAQADAQGAGL